MLNSLINKYHGQGIEDDGSYISEEFKKFAKDFYSALSKRFPVTRFNIGHYDVSGFLRNNGKIIYYSYSVPRGELPINTRAKDAMNGILIRLAKDEKDYTGGINHFTNFFDFDNDVEALTK